ncbi:MAG: DMT family transporter [Nitrososphaerales archaeon]
MQKKDGRAFIASAGILYGTVTVGASLLTKNGLTALEISFFFLFLSILPLGLVVALTREGFLGRVRSSSRYLALYAGANTFLVLSQFSSISLGLSPAITALLLYTQPVWTVIFGRIFFNDTIDRSRIGVILLALAGIALITNPVLPTGGPLNVKVIVSEGLALTGGIFLAIWIILGKKGRLGAFKDPLELTLAVRGSTLIPIALISISSITFYPTLFLSNPGIIWSNLLWLFAFSIIAGIVPDFLFYAGIEKVAALQAGVILLLEPISAAVISAILMISGLGVMQVAGGILILLSNYFAIRSKP